MTKRYRCVRCRSFIDPDLYSCPFCNEPDPLRYLRARRIVGVVLAVALLLGVSAWAIL